MVEAVRMLGAKGGHLGPRRDGPPGTQVLRRGLQRLDTAVQMALPIRDLMIRVSSRTLCLLAYITGRTISLDSLCQD